MRAAQYLFALLFLFAAVVQFNDPDPVAWMAAYLAAATVCVLAARPARSRSFWIAPLAVAVAALSWSAWIWLTSPHPLVASRMFDQWEMKDVAVEESREIFGLLIVAGWMLVTARRAHVSRRDPKSSQGPSAPGTQPPEPKLPPSDPTRFPEEAPRG
jgi:energy-coupling factor transporter transmembrane protein EcfT